MTSRLILIPLLIAIATANASAAWAQDKGTVDPKPLPPLANPNDPRIGAKELFARRLKPNETSAPHSVGFYAHGCLDGGVALPINGATWQVMRLSRNRNWGHPTLIQFIERLSASGAKVGWPGLLVGDMSQPRGGPMITGHASHQVGLDADVWLTPMPDHRLSREEREDMSAVMMVRPDRLDIDTHVWTPAHLAVIRDAALEPRVQRIFVNPAIKKALCREAKGDRSWLSKVRPFWGHDYHFHIRMMCPEGSKECKSQPEPSESEGCAASDFAYWFKDSVLHPKPPKVPPKPNPGLTLAQLPPDCRTVLAAPDARQ